MSLDQWLLFVGVCIAASMTPGPGILTVIAHSINIGVKRTIPLMFGILVGLSLLSLLSILGLGTILESSKTLFTVVKLLGAGYLFYLGIRLVLSKNNTEATVRPDVIPSNPTKQFVHGVCVSLVNPKAIGFFSALFIQFVDESSGLFLQLIILYSTLVGCSIFSLLFYSIGAQLITPALKEYALIFNRITGGCFIGLSVILIFSEN